MRDLDQEINPLRWSDPSLEFGPSHIPIVALTAWMSELWRKKAWKVGIKTYLLKPVSSQTLKETIEEFTNESFIRANAVTPPI